MKGTTRILQGVPPLSKVCTDPLTEDNNQNFARDSPTEIFFFGQSGISSTNWREQPEFWKGYPNELFFYFFGQSGISSTIWREQPEFCKGFPHWALFFGFFGKKDQVAYRQAGVWIDFHFSDFFC